MKILFSLLLSLSLYSDTIIFNSEKIENGKAYWIIYGCKEGKEYYLIKKEPLYYDIIEIEFDNLKGSSTGRNCQMDFKHISQFPKD